MRHASIVLLCLALLAACAVKPSDNAARNIQLLRQYYELGKAREHARQDALWAPGAMNLGKPVSADGIRRAIEDIYRTFPDYDSQVLETRALGDTVVQLSRMSGTHRGVAQMGIFGGLLQGARPTGRRFEVLVTHWWRFDSSGRIAWHEVTRDDLGMYRQLGLVPDTLPTEKLVSPVQ
jgi:predicted ester cyclase